MRENGPRTVIYPCTRDEVSIIRYSTLVDGLEVIGGAALPGSGHPTGDAATLDGGLDCGKKVYATLAEIVARAELIAYTGHDAVRQHPKGDGELTWLAGSKCPILPLYDFGLNAKFRLAVGGRRIRWLDRKLDHIDRIANTRRRAADSVRERIHTPVIMVVGTGEWTDKFEVQLQLHRSLKNARINAYQMGSRRYSELFGFHSLPRYIFDPELREVEKVARLRRTLAFVECEIKPDFFVIGLPGGLIKRSEYLSNGYGLLHFAIMQEFRPDILVVTLYRNDLASDAMEEILARTRGFGRTIFVVSNTAIDEMASAQQGAPCFIRAERWRTESAPMRRGGPCLTFYSGLSGRVLKAAIETEIGNLANFGIV